ncbi:hypothetical protein [Fluviispira vulneris]|uniref:hypothetical protein n=1 Tax=Fluviispira vulneris TaxID=2763012 RepID=UPI001648C60C|nr:hypothetical protein [Fluviispira vulneris]
MNKQKLFFYFIFMISFLLHERHSVAEEVKVICSNKNQKWELLDKGNTKVQGKWQSMPIDENQYFVHFVIENDISQVIALKEKCIEEFGKEFYYAQPFSGIWTPFSTNNCEFLDGHITSLQEEEPGHSFLRFG